ncbi:MAG TPA: hypothetical protein VN697_03490 [Tepidiformaceae bacterium]|jgi:hypothetical protein|nr:hypothetical protein [Tepidiformaceae bacterium]
MSTTPEDTNSSELDTDSADSTNVEDRPVDTITVGGTEDALKGVAPETANLVDSIKEDEQQEIADAVFEDFETDWSGSTKFRQRRAEILKLALGELPPKEDGYSQIHYSIIMKAVVKLAARVYDQQFPSNGEFFGIRPTSAADLPRCVRVAKHLNWQVLHQIPEYVPNHDALIMQWYLYGSAFTFIYWNPVKNRPCHEICPTEDIVLPYAYPQFANEPSMSGLPRITRIVRKYRYGADGLDAWARSGYYSKMNVEELFGDDDEDKDDATAGNMTSGSEVSDPVREVIDRASGVKKPEKETPARRELLEQHRWWKLDEWPEERPVIATIDRATKTLIGFVVRADEDPEDRARYNREKQADDAAYEMAMQQYEQDLQAYQANAISILGGIRPGAMPPPQMGMPTPAMGPPPAMSMTAPPMPGAMTPTMPVAPQPMTPPVAPKKKPLPKEPTLVPIHFFTHFICIPNPEGIYGFGIGYLLEGNNLAADSLGSALVDSAVRANTQTGIASREAKLGAGEWRIKPGEIMKTELLPGEIDGAIKFLQFPKPEPTLGEVIKDQKEEAEELSGASDILSGEVGGSNETATTTQIRISQALAAVSIQGKRYGRSRTSEGEKFARLNSVYLGDVEYFSVIDPYHQAPPQAEDGTYSGLKDNQAYHPSVGMVEDHSIARQDYLEDVAITVTADPRMASQPQRFQEAMQAIQVTQNAAAVAPWIAQNPQLWMVLLRALFTAMDRPDLVALVQPPPPQIPVAPAPGGMPVRGAPQGGPPRPPQQPQGNGQSMPHPHPQPPGMTVPNSGGAPVNAPFMNQGQ